METIKSYIESMFRNLPQTEKVLRAKSELFQMMEDKYTELIKEGKSENEAVGTVISEFGNLEEIANDLGIADIYKSTREENINRRKLSFAEVEGFLAANRKSATKVGLGVLMCICCVIWPIITDALKINEKIGIIGLFITIAVGVSLFIISNTDLEEYKFLYNENCSIDAAESEFLRNKRREYSGTYSVKLSIGILLCVMCFIPAALLSDIDVLEDFAAAALFLMVGVGVYFITSANIIRKSFDQLLNINTSQLKHNREDEQIKKIENKTVRVIMSVYWQTITCIYLCISFLTSSWHITWLIWPIAAAVRGILIAIYANQEENN